jgi:hypothetical protein
MSGGVTIALSLIPSAKKYGAFEKGYMEISKVIQLNRRQEGVRKLIVKFSVGSKNSNVH